MGLKIKEMEHNCMDFLIITEDYPNKNNKYANSYVHSRCIEYKKSQLNFKVLSFRAQTPYIYEGIDIISEDEFQKKYKNKKINLVISHAPNIRNHLKFLMIYRKNIKKMLFFLHGHEVLKINKYYPKPYDFTKDKSIIKNLTQNFYDSFKLKVLKTFFLNNLKKNKVKFVFVSKWMKIQFLKNVQLDPYLIDRNSYIIFNNANAVFEKKTYLKKKKTKADVVTIRPLDKSKYGVDLVCKIAENNPDIKFHIYGRGQYFSFHKQPKNVEVFQKFFTHEELAEELNYYKLALMPTRLDAQGVMVCEMTTYGIPVLTSDLPICKEMTNEFSNVFYFNNLLVDKVKISNVINQINLERPINKEKFSINNTVKKEIKLILMLIDNKDINKGI